MITETKYIKYQIVILILKSRKISIFMWLNVKHLDIWKHLVVYYNVYFSLRFFIVINTKIKYTIAH